MRRSIIRINSLGTGSHRAALVITPPRASTECLDDREADGGDNGQDPQRVTYSHRDLANTG